MKIKNKIRWYHPQTEYIWATEYINKIIHIQICIGLRIAPQVQLIYHIRFYIITYPLMCHSFNTMLIPFVEQFGMIVLKAFF